MNMDKKEIRKVILAKRASMSEELRQEKSRSIIEKVISLPEFSKARNIMTYLDFKGEVETRDLITAILKYGIRVVVPLCHGNNIIPCLLEHPEHDIEPGTWGVPEPRKEKVRPLPPGEIDLAVVPGVAFDTQGNRLGYGKGYYDRFLPQLREDVLKIGICFDCQIVDHLHTDAHDYRMSLLITESAVIYPG